MSMKRTILIKEVKYSNQAKTVLGMTKMIQVTTRKIVTVQHISNYLGSGKGAGYSRDAALGKSPPAQN